MKSRLLLLFWKAVLTFDLLSFCCFKSWVNRNKNCESLVLFCCLFLTTACKYYQKKAQKDESNRFTHVICMETCLKHKSVRINNKSTTEAESVLLFSSDCWGAAEQGSTFWWRASALSWTLPCFKSSIKTWRNKKFTSCSQSLGARLLLCKRHLCMS